MPIAQSVRCQITPPRATLVEQKQREERKSAMSTPLIGRPASDGASAQLVSADYALPATAGSVGAQLAAVLGLLTGVWVAVSPWFLTLQQGGTNANAVNLISGLAIAVVSAFALANPRGFASLQVGSALLGVWLIVAGPILSEKYAVSDSMFWSNSWAGAVLIAAAAAGLAAVALRGPVRR
jgi:hypothetical protein